MTWISEGLFSFRRQIFPAALNVLNSLERDERLPAGSLDAAVMEQLSYLTVARQVPPPPPPPWLSLTHTQTPTTITHHLTAPAQPVLGRYALRIIVCNYLRQSYLTEMLSLPISLRSSMTVAV